MSVRLHLVLRKLIVQSSTEWLPGCQCSDAWIIIRVTEGTGYWLRGGSGGELNIGDGLVLAFDDKTQLRASLLCPMKLEFFTIQPQYLGLLTVTEWHQLKTLFENSPSFFMAFRDKEPMGQQFAQLAERLQGCGLSARCALLQFWADLTAGFLPPATNLSSQGNKLQDRFQKLFSQMSEAELVTCTSVELAQHLNCSLRHFWRLFRAEYGVPLQVRQQELRLLFARKLLTESDATVIAIANQCGHKHLSHFISMFRKRFGMTPGEWRRHAKKNRLESPDQNTDHTAIAQSDELSGKTPQRQIPNHTR